MKEEYLSKLSYKHLHSKANANAENSYYHSAQSRIVAEVTKNADNCQIPPQQGVGQIFCTCTHACRAINRECNALVSNTTIVQTFQLKEFPLPISPHFFWKKPTIISEEIPFLHSFIRSFYYY